MWKKTLIFIVVILINCQGQEAKNSKSGSTATRPPNGPNSPAPGVGNENAPVETKDVYEAVWKREKIDFLDQLPVSGSVDPLKIPYSGFWYPDNYGGTGIKYSSQESSALEKYDRVFNNNEKKASSWEDANHGQSDVSWAGHCNGWAAASQRQGEPKNQVTKNNVTFQPRDIKALLAEIHMSAKPVFLAGDRCNQPSMFEGPFARWLNPNNSNSNCKPLDAGMFHIVLANWIGREKHAIIFDKNSSEQVWNYPIYAYQSTVQKIPREEAQRQIGGFFNSGHKFSDETVSFALVQTQITHADSLSEEGESNTFPTRVPENVSYSYILELAADGHIITGQWTAATEPNRPDFLWVAFEPFQNEEQKQMFGNPFLNVNEVIKLWAESVGDDPGHPSLDILAP